MVLFSSSPRSRGANHLAISVLSLRANADVRRRRDAFEPSNPPHHTSITRPITISKAPQPICCHPALSWWVWCLGDGWCHRRSASSPSIDALWWILIVQEPQPICSSSPEVPRTSHLLPHLVFDLFIKMGNASRKPLSGYVTISNHGTWSWNISTIHNRWIEQQKTQ
jgi:hypothetical protein